MATGHVRRLRGFPWARVGFVTAAASTVAMAAVLARGGEVAWAWWGVTLLTLSATVGLGVFVQGAGLFARPVLAAHPDDAAGRVALTFDDGPDADETRAVAALLEAEGQRATFFFIGARAEGERALVDELKRRGHGVGNHSYAHAHASPFWSVARLVADLRRAAGVHGAARWYRAPVGIVSPRVADAAAALRLELVGWSASARDGRDGVSIDDAWRRLLPALRPGAILVLHDGVERGARRPLAAAVLARLLPEMRARGLRSVTLDELFGDRS